MFCGRNKMRNQAAQTCEDDYWKQVFFLNLQCTCAAYFLRFLHRMITMHLCYIFGDFFPSVFWYNGTICVPICCRPCMQGGLYARFESIHLFRASYMTRILLHCVRTKSTPWSSYEHLISRMWIVIPQNAPMWMCGLSPPNSSFTRETRSTFSKRNVLLRRMTAVVRHIFAAN